MNIYFWEIILSKKDKPFKQTGIDGGKNLRGESHS